MMPAVVKIVIAVQKISPEATTRSQNASAREWPGQRSATAGVADFSLGRCEVETKTEFLTSLTAISRRLRSVRQPAAWQWFARWPPCRRQSEERSPPPRRTGRPCPDND